ncbi:MAG: hypothetical protein ACP5XB_08765 [Isosphaeraceae bacterium]
MSDLGDDPRLRRDESRVIGKGSQSMAGRRAISSPIFYSALLACGLIGLYYGVELASPLVGKWVEQWRLTRSMHSVDARSRLGTVLMMEHLDPALTTPYLIEATGDADVQVRVAACRVVFWPPGRRTGRSFCRYYLGRRMTPTRTFAPTWPRSWA